MNWVAGVDGCRAGWIVVLLRRTQRTWTHQVTLCPKFADILSLDPTPDVIAIDIPIGLLDQPQSGGRECDRQARQLLGRRASSIFTPPTRPMLKATRYEQVRQQGLSVQSFNILPKIREVDQLMTPVLQQRVHEAHPELAFMSLAGVPIQYNKKTREGREERIQTFSHWLLPHQADVTYRNVTLNKAKNLPHQCAQKRFSTPLRSVQNDQLNLREILRSAQSFHYSQVAPDDILDAYVLAWTALRIKAGQASRIPADPLVDRKGLRMEIWY